MSGQGNALTGGLGKIGGMDFAKPNLTLVVDRRLYRPRKDREPLSLIEEAIAGGVTMVQMRVPNGEADGDLGVYAIAQRLREITLDRVPFIVTGDLELAERCRADGVLLPGERTYKPTAARGFLRGKEGLVGCFVRTVAGASRAERGGADYIQVGPVFSERKGAGGEAGEEGVRLLRKVKDAVNVPVVAFGGITSSRRALEAIENGADGIAVTHAILSAPDPLEAAASLATALARA